MYEYSCIVVHVIDGNTFEADIDVGFRIHYRAAIRLAGYHAPALCMETGPQWRGRLVALVAGKEVTVRTVSFKECEQNGWVLGFVTASDRDHAYLVNDVMKAELVHAPAGASDSST